MKYIAKEKEIKRIKDIYKMKLFMDELDFTMPFLSRVFGRHLSVPRSTAFAIVKVIDLNAKVEDYFEKEK